MHYAIVDIETTGGSPKDSKITEIAIYKHDGDKVIDEYSTLINPEIPIPPFIVRLTGITDNMVANSPRFHEVAKEIIQFTDGCVFVAHNVGFDYGVIRAEYRSLGFDFRLPHLCTVQTSRKVIPGHDSYSLGKLTRSLGIDLIGRHRAGGDALATAHLFALLMKEDGNGLSLYIKEELNPKKLHENLSLEALDEIPDKTGIYKFYNEDNQLIYIGKSIHLRKRIDQHLRNNKTSKSIKMQKEIARVEFLLTGSELIALLLESQLIKQHQPIYNRSLKKYAFPYGLFQYTDNVGYLRLYICSVSKMKEVPLISFNSKKEGVNFLEKKIEEFELCQKLCDLYKSNSSCFQYTVKSCLGACVKEESPENYNTRCESFLKDLNFNSASFYIIDKGRERNEKSLIYIEKGSFRGMGHAPFHFRKTKKHNWDKFIDFTENDRDSQTIIRLFLRKNKDSEIISI